MRTLAWACMLTCFHCSRIGQPPNRLLVGGHETTTKSHSIHSSRVDRSGGGQNRSPYLLLCFRFSVMDERRSRSCPAGVASNLPTSPLLKGACASLRHSQMGTREFGRLLALVPVTVQAKERLSVYYQLSQRRREANRVHHEASNSSTTQDQALKA